MIKLSIRVYLFLRMIFIVCALVSSLYFMQTSWAMSMISETEAGNYIVNSTTLALNSNDYEGKYIAVTEDIYCEVKNCSMVPPPAVNKFFTVRTEKISELQRVDLILSCERLCTMTIYGKFVDGEIIATDIVDLFGELKGPSY